MVGLVVAEAEAAEVLVTEGDWQNPSSLSVSSSQQLDVFTNLEALQTPLVRGFMEA